ncbi:MAG: hypothetical protein Q8O03_00335 [Nanoarchaeota archaeon]|nr:hypothetical protein [Nanoarchaeota archaeon]
MKVPNIFVPEKDLERKTEEFRGGYREVKLEELMANNLQIIHGDATHAQRIENIEDIASKILQDTVSGVIKWEEDIIPNLNYSKCYTSKATIPNYRQEPMIVPVTFLISESPAGEKFGYLYLGDEKGFQLIPFVTSEKVRQVFKEYFK